MNYKFTVNAEACKDFQAGKISSEIFLFICKATSPRNKTDKAKRMIENLYQTTGYRPVR
jgi:hypothetical protein